MWWKIYFWLGAIFLVAGFIFVYGKLEVWSFADWFEIASVVIGFIGLYAYVYKKNLLSSQFWKIFFWVIITSWTFNLVYMFTPLEEALQLPRWLTSSSVLNETELIIAILANSPLAYAIYRLGQKRS